MAACPACGTILPQPGEPCPACGESTLTRTPLPDLQSFEVLRPLGEGGMGVVYLAKDRKLQRLVAVKLLSPRVAADEDARDRFLREARSMASVEHPNIARIYSFGQEREHTYIEMEFVDGESLAARLARTGRMTVAEAVPIVLQVARALELAASKGIVHRDVKPSNVLLTRSSEVRVADFGLAKPAAGLEDPVITGTGAMVGTPSYVSPEQARGEKVDHRSDIYSLGVMTYEMLAGDKPFKGPTPVAIVAKHLNEPLPPLEKAVPGVPPALARLVARMTEKNPEERLSSYAELRAVLSAMEREPTPVGSRPRAGAALAAAGLVALLAAGVFLARRPTPQVPSGSATVEMEKLTSRGTVRSPVLSPDGRYLAHVSDDGGPSTLWLRDVGERTEVALVNPIEGEYALAHFFSRDGAQIYFSAIPAGRDSRRLYRVPLIGGQARVVADGYWPLLSPDGNRLLYWRADDGAFVTADGNRTEVITPKSSPAASAVWSPAGDRVLLSGPGSLSVVDLETKETREIPHSLPRDADSFYAVWRPDDEVAAVLVDTTRDSGSLYTVDLRTGETHPLGVTLWVVFSVEWLADGSALVVNAAKDSNSRHRIWLVDYPTGALRAVTPEGGEYGDVQIAPDAKSIVAQQTIARSEILVSSPGTARFTRTKAGTDVDYSLTWVAGGKLVYSSNEAGSYDLYVADPSADDRTRLTFETVGDEFDPSTAPDGKTVVFVSYLDNESSLWRIEIDGTGLRRLTAPIDGFRWMRPRVSPNGEDVIYMDWTNGPVLSMVGIDGADSTPIRGWRDGEPMESREYAFGAGWSPDGARIAFFHFNVAEEWSPIGIAIASLSGPITQTLPYTESKVARVGDHQQIDWSADGATLFFQRDGNLWAQPISGGAATQITHFDEPIGDYEWSEDGRILACTRTTTLSDAVVLKSPF